MINFSMEFNTVRICCFSEAHARTVLFSIAVKKRRLGFGHNDAAEEGFVVNEMPRVSQIHRPKRIRPFPVKSADPAFLLVHNHA